MCTGLATCPQGWLRVHRASSASDPGAHVQVIQGDVEEALRLMNMSKVSLDDEPEGGEKRDEPVREAFAKV